MALPIKRHKESDVIQAQSLATTTTTGVGAAVTGIGGAVIALLPEIAKVPVSEPLQVAGLAVVGLAIVGWGIATAGDALARAYATAHVDTKGKPLMGAVLSEVTFGVSGIQNDGSDAKEPALAAAVQRLAEAHENATFGVSGIQNDGSDAKEPALAAAVQRLAEAHENATFGVSGIQNDGSDAKKPALAEALKALCAHDDVRVKNQIVEAPPGLRHHDGQQAFQVAALFFPRKGVVQQLYFDASGEPHLTEPLEIAQ